MYQYIILLKHYLPLFFEFTYFLLLASLSETGSANPLMLFSHISKVPVILSPDLSNFVWIFFTRAMNFKLADVSNDDLLLNRDPNTLTLIFINNKNYLVIIFCITQIKYQTIYIHYLICITCICNNDHK